MVVFTKRDRQYGVYIVCELTLGNAEAILDKLTKQSKDLTNWHPLSLFLVGLRREVAKLNAH
jgi:hypothetical protein